MYGLVSSAEKLCTRTCSAFSNALFSTMFSIKPIVFWSDIANTSKRSRSGDRVCSIALWISPRTPIICESPDATAM